MFTISIMGRAIVRYHAAYSLVRFEASPAPIIYQRYCLTIHAPFHRPSLAADYRHLHPLAAPRSLDAQSPPLDTP